MRHNVILLSDENAFFFIPVYQKCQYGFFIKLYRENKPKVKIFVSFYVVKIIFIFGILRKLYLISKTLPVYDTIFFLRILVYKIYKFRVMTDDCINTFQ